MKSNGYGVSLKTPCYKCENRKEACHSTCGAYKNWAELKARKDAEIRKERNKERDMNNFIKETRERARRRK